MTPHSSPLLQDLEYLYWFPFSDEPIVHGKWFQPRISHPFVLFPEDSSDDKWHLFCHSWLGLHHYVSSSGLSWEHFALIEYNGKYPSIYVEDGVYYLFYEKRGRRLPFINKRRGREESGEYHRESHIEMRSSTDLQIWSNPRHIISANDINTSSAFIRKGHLSHPQLLPYEQGYRLYVGASLVDTALDITRYTMSAISPEILGPYQQEGDQIVVEADGNDYYRSLGAGQLQVYCEDTFCYAIQNSYYYDEERNKKASAIILLKSTDGLHFTPIEVKPILTPPEKGWASDHLLTSSLRYKEDESCWYCYFSGVHTNSYHLTTESIGLLIGKDSRPRKIENTNDLLYRES
jgi:hypothetical protein